MKTLEEKFWERVDKDGPIHPYKPELGKCWLWTGQLNNKESPYGAVYHGGKRVKAHRISYIIHHGVIPDGKMILHSCDRHHCTNPNHLYAGDQFDNMKDAASRERLSTKLNAQQVDEIRGLFRTISNRAIARQFGVTEWCIRRIVNGVGWKHAERNRGKETAS